MNNKVRSNAMHVCTALVAWSLLGACKRITGLLCCTAWRVHRSQPRDPVEDLGRSGLSTETRGASCAVCVIMEIVMEAALVPPEREACCPAQWCCLARFQESPTGNPLSHLLHLHSSSPALRGGPRLEAQSTPLARVPLPAHRNTSVSAASCI